MNQYCRKLFRVGLPLFIITLFAFPSNATTVVMLSDKELILNSRFIITASVSRVTSAWDDARAMAWTYVEVRPERVLKGNLSAETLVLKQLGGNDGYSGIRVFGLPEFVPGQKALLYLNTGPDGTLHVAHAFMGMFSIVEESATGRKLVVRSNEASEVEILSREDEDGVTDRAPFDSYVRNIEETLQRESAQVAQIEAERRDEPVVAIPSEYWRKRRESSGYVPEFALIGGGVRWMQADSGQPILFYVNPSMSPIGGGGQGEIARAMSAWSSQTGANINLQIGGSTNSCGVVSDNVNSISFGDCMNQLDPASGCSGVVALTSSSWSFETRSVGGRIFNRLVESDIIFNKGMDCFLSNSANLAEVACHELGHAIGLDHSSDPSAIMWASAHGRGHDAVLADDDKAGILAIYPGSGGGGTGGGGTGGGGGGTGGGGTGGGGGGTGGGGTGGGGPITITSINLPNAVVGRSYKQVLNATGGSMPYRWSIAGGQVPSGLTLSAAGVLQGTPTQSGTYSIGVQVVDASSANLDSKRVTITVVGPEGNPSASPTINRVKVKGSKKLWIYGENFHEDSVIILNGIFLSPKSFEHEGASGQLFYKGKLNLGPGGSNLLFIQNSDNRSAAFYF
ncbi:MAG: putative Ig domain-containing protein [Blastocatellia bacterium]